MKFGSRGETFGEYIERKISRRVNRIKTSPLFYFVVDCLPFSSKLTLFKHLWQRKLGAAAEIVQLSLEKGAIFFDRNHLPDWKVLSGVFSIQEYAMDFSDSILIDIGAHKGFLTAYALNHGVAEVHMYEPAPQNIMYLEKLVGSVPNGKISLFVEGVSDKDGSMDFYIYEESWSHSLVKRENLKPKSIEKVNVVSLNEVIARAAQKNSKIAVKIDAEGEEQRMLLGVDSDILQKVNELWVEVHKYSKADFTAIIKKLEDSGLIWKNPKKLNYHSHHLLHFKKSGS